MGAVIERRPGTSACCMPACCPALRAADNTCAGSGCAADHNCLPPGKPTAAYGRGRHATASRRALGPPAGPTRRREAPHVVVHAHVRAVQRDRGARVAGKVVLCDCRQLPVVAREHLGVWLRGVADKLACDGAEGQALCPPWDAADECAVSAPTTSSRAAQQHAMLAPTCKPDAPHTPPALHTPAHAPAGRRGAAGAAARRGPPRSAAWRPRQPPACPAGQSRPAAPASACPPPA